MASKTTAPAAQTVTELDFSGVSVAVTAAPIVHKRPAPWLNTPIVAWIDQAQETKQTIRVGPFADDKAQRKVVSWVRQCAAARELGIKAQWDTDGFLNFRTKPITRRPRKASADN